MKLFAIGRNYISHIEELHNERSEQPIIFTKPDTAIIHHNEPFIYPDFSKNIHYETELIIQISKQGKNIKEEIAYQYYNSIGIGIDFTARDLQQEAKKKGLPWDIAKGFDGSAPISDSFLPVSDFHNIDNINFRLEIDGEVKQQGNTRFLLFNFNYIISYLSIFFTLKVGDIIFTGTPKGVGPVTKGNQLSAYIEDKKMMECEIK